MAHQHAREFCLATQCFPKCCVNRHLNTADAPPCDLSISVLLSLAQDACAWAARGRGKEDFHSGSGLLHFSTLYDCALHEGHESGLKSSPLCSPRHVPGPGARKGFSLRGPVLQSPAVLPAERPSAMRDPHRHARQPRCSAEPRRLGTRVSIPTWERSEETKSKLPLSASPRSPTSLLHLFMSPA